MARARMKPIHPGEILLEEFLGPMGITQYRLAKDLRVPMPRISEIVRRQRSISADTALRLSRYFGTSDKFWLNLQSHYDLERQKDESGKRIDREVPILSTLAASSRRRVSLAVAKKK